MDYHWIPVMYSIHCVYKRLFGGVSQQFIGLGGGFLGVYWSRRWISRSLLVSEVDFSQFIGLGGGFLGKVGAKVVQVGANGGVLRNSIGLGGGFLGKGGAKVVQVGARVVEAPPENPLQTQ